MKTTIDIYQPQLSLGRTPKTIAAFALICGLFTSAHAQLGSGWTPDNETYIAQNSSGTTTTAISGGYEFKIPTVSGLCRAEMRGNNLPTNVTNQWQGLGTLVSFPSGSTDITCHQVFGPAPSTPDLILDEAQYSGGIEIMSLEQSKAFEAQIQVGVQFQMNTIYDPVGNLIYIYVNGTQTGTKVPNSGIHYNKYGQYVSLSGAGPSTFDWVNVQSWSGGTPPGSNPTTFTITASAGANGSISPSGGVVVNQGANQSFTITPNSGYNVSSVTVDGSSQGAITSYTFSNVQANHTISAAFQAVTTTFTITASAGANGSISPSGGVVVNQGANQSFTITPNSGYNVSSVTVDGAGQGAITSYTFSNVQANHTISATFQQQSVSEGPYGGTAAAIPGTVQAENYDVGGQGVAYNATSINGTDNGYRSDGVDLEVTSDTGGGVDLGWTFAGNWFKYTVNVATAGTYTVSFRVAGPSAVTDAFHISNSSGTNLSGNVNIPALGGWQTWGTVTASVTLPAGQQILTINQDNGGWNFNYVTFQQQSSGEAPFGGTAAAIPGTVQAENYDTGGQGVAYNVGSINGTDNGYRSDGVDLEACSDTGGGVDLGWTSPGQWFKYTVNVATAGTYTVSFRIAAPNAVTDAFHLSNSSGTNLSGNVNLPATGGYQNWATVTANVTLPAGQQILTLNQDTGGGIWNINYASFATSGGGTTVATPTFSPAGGTYSSAQSVTLSDSTGGATIYYTTDGSTPTTSSTVYSSAIAVNSGTVTIQAMAALSGDTNSAVASATYTISTVATVATPTFSPAGGTYSTAQTVSISDSTGGATIHYTTDGSTPTASSTVYSSPIAVSSGTVTIQAMGVLAGDNNSAVGSATYTISTGGGGCQTATSSWTSVAATSVSGTFTATFDATPHASGITGFVGMTSGAASSKSSAAWLVKFHSTGDIQAANGSSFTAGATINWVSGSTYHFRVVANTTAGTYSVYVTPPGQGEQTLATNYAFQVSATSLDHIGLQDTAASLQVCNFTD